MWTSDEQRRLFGLTSYYNGIGDYNRALDYADQLLALLQVPSAPYAYVLGCRKAVIGRHQGYLDDAETISRQAEEMALGTKEPAIVAYILADRSAMYTGEKAIDTACQALAQILLARRTPDPERTVSADQAYLQAVLARALTRAGRHEEARLWIRSAKKALRKYAHGSHPRYKDAYLSALVWDFERKPSLRGLFVLISEVIRQKKLRNAAFFYRRLRKAARSR